MISIIDLKNLMQKFYHAFSIPVSIYKKSQCVASFVPKAFSPDPAYLCLKDHLTDPLPLSYISHHNVHCGYLEMAGTDYLILLGPVSAIPCNSAQIDDVLADFSLPFTRKRELEYWLARIPWTDLAHFKSMLHFLNYAVNGNSTNLPDADAITMAEPQPYSRISNPVIHHNSKKIESQILAAITSGSPNALLKLLHKIKDMDISFAQTGTSSVQVLRNILITASVLASRAAISGGLDYDFALTLSDYYIKMAYSISKEEQFTPLIGTLMLDFCSRVQELELPKNSSPLTRSIISDVHAHLYGKLTVSEIASRLGYSESHISHVFKSDMEVSLKSWIQNQKLKEAERLKTLEHKTASEIALLLGYSSVSHLLTTYKKWKSLPPA